MQNSSSSSRSTSGKAYIAFLIFIAVLGAFSSLVNDMYLPTIPKMMRQFHTTPSATQLGLSLAMAGLGVGSVIWGSLSDRYGRKGILIISLAVFVAGTSVSLFSRDITFFIICRFFQGLGAGGPMVLSTSIPADVYSGRRLAAAMAVIGAINGFAPAAGPLAGGFLADAVGWKGIFLVLLAIGIVMGLCTARMKETLPPDRRAKATGLRQYWTLYRGLFANGRFMIYVCIKAAGIALLYAYISSAPFILQDHYGFSATHFGMIFGANALAIAVGSWSAMKFRILKQAMVTGAVGMFVFAIGAAAVMYCRAHFWLYELMCVPMLLFGGMIFSSANTLSMAVGRQDAGTASAILSVVKYAFAAVVAPLCGIGTIMHSSAIVFGGCAFVTLGLAYLAYRLKPLPGMVEK